MEFHFLKAEKPVFLTLRFEEVFGFNIREMGKSIRSLRKVIGRVDFRDRHRCSK